MRFPAILTAVLLGASLSGCNMFKAEEAPDSSYLDENVKNLTEKFEAIDESQLRLQLISGTWTSNAGAVKSLREKWLSLYIAGDSTINLEIRGPGVKMETVYVTANGKLDLADGRIKGVIENCPEILKDFEEFSAGAPKSGVLDIVGKNGVTIRMNYKGA